MKSEKNEKAAADGIIGDTESSMSFETKQQILNRYIKPNICTIMVDPEREYIK
jgi:hypothetical protein